MKLVGAVSVKNRAAKILLDADTPLTYYTILSKWSVRTVPAVREIQQILAKYNIFVKVGIEKTPGYNGTNNRITYSHIDHAKLQEWLTQEPSE